MLITEPMPGDAHRAYRNMLWEGDYLEFSHPVEVGGELHRPWVTWFVDSATRLVMGAAPTPRPPSQASVLVALRASILRTGQFGPAGGLPGAIRINRGKDLPSSVVSGAAGRLDVQVEEPSVIAPGYKSVAETVGGAMKRELSAATQGMRMTFEEFATALFTWIEHWNTKRRITGLGGLTPLEAWNADPAPITEASGPDPTWIAPNDSGRLRSVTPAGIVIQGRKYQAEWMTGHVGREVRVHVIPGDLRLVEVFSATSTEYLGPGHAIPELDPRGAGTVTNARAVSRGRVRSACAVVQGDPDARPHPDTYAGNAGDHPWADESACADIDEPAPDPESDATHEDEQGDDADHRL